MLKTNIMKRTTLFKDSTIEWNIEGRNLKINITGDEIHIISLLKLILRETKLYNFTYYRVSPFKIRKIYHKKENSYDIQIQFYNVKDNYKLNKQTLITTLNGLSVIGQVDIFIPDFLEICVLMKLLDRDEIGYKVISNIESIGSICEYIQKRSNIQYYFKKLENRGFIIPKRLN